MNPLSDDQLKHIQDMHTQRRSGLTRLFEEYRSDSEAVKEDSFKRLADSILGLNLHSDEAPTVGDAVIVVSGSNAGLVGVVNNITGTNFFGIAGDDDFEYVESGFVRKLKVQPEGVSK